jgi:hypothetical protein
MDTACPSIGRRRTAPLASRWRTKTCSFARLAIFFGAVAVLALTEVGAASVKKGYLEWAKGPYTVMPVASEDATEAPDFEYAGMTDEDQTPKIEAEMMPRNYSEQVAEMKAEEKDMEHTLDASEGKTEAIDNKEGALNKYVMDEVDSFAEAIRMLNKKMTDAINDAPEVPGPPGLPGINGHNGDDGLEGLTGKNGTKGVTGKLGKPGPEGEDGEEGETGRAGACGCVLVCFARA